MLRFNHTAFAVPEGPSVPACTAARRVFPGTREAGRTLARHRSTRQSGLRGDREPAPPQSFRFRRRRAGNPRRLDGAGDRDIHRSGNGHRDRRNPGRAGGHRQRVGRRDGVVRADLAAIRSAHERGVAGTRRHRGADVCRGCCHRRVAADARAEQERSNPAGPLISLWGSSSRCAGRQRPRGRRARCGPRRGVPERCGRDRS